MRFIQAATREEHEATAVIGATYYQVTYLPDGSDWCAAVEEVRPGEQEITEADFLAKRAANLDAYAQDADARLAAAEAERAACAGKPEQCYGEYLDQYAAATDAQLADARRVRPDVTWAAQPPLALDAFVREHAGEHDARVAAIAADVGVTRLRIHVESRAGVHGVHDGVPSLNDVIAVVATTPSLARIAEVDEDAAMDKAIELATIAVAEREQAAADAQAREA